MTLELETCFNKLGFLCFKPPLILAYNPAPCPHTHAHRRTHTEGFRKAGIFKKKNSPTFWEICFVVRALHKDEKHGETAGLILSKGKKQKTKIYPPASLKLSCTFFY